MEVRRADPATVLLSVCESLASAGFLGFPECAPGPRAILHVPLIGSAAPTLGPIHTRPGDAVHARDRRPLAILSRTDSTRGPRRATHCRRDGNHRRDSVGFLG